MGSICITQIGDAMNCTRGELFRAPVRYNKIIVSSPTLRHAPQRAAKTNP
jgi:hypothetical protein